MLFPSHIASKPLLPARLRSALTLLNHEISVLLTIETPALLGRKYQLNPQQTGLCFVAYLLGALLGEVRKM